MGKDNIQFKVEGESKVVKALDKVANFDTEKASNEAARALLPRVKSGTRYKTGALQGAWDVQEGQFVNETRYAVPQEFGTPWQEGAFATIRAFAEGEQEALEAYDKVVTGVIEQAGFDTK